jgi:cytochrome c oxidase subunit II
MKPRTLFDRCLQLTLIVVTWCLTACVGVDNESAFGPAGPQAGRITSLWWFMFAVATAVWVIVMASLVWSVRRGRRRAEALPEPAGETSMRKAVIIGAGVTVLILTVFLISDITTGRALGALPRKKALRVEVVGHQWWWEVNYIDPVAGRMVTTANEIHIPVGEPVQIIGTSRDVIHSLWIPSLQGKKDLIPGHVTSTWLRADKPGIYRGQCAEFCGAQHAKMVALVIAEPRPKFDAWYNAQLTSPPAPSDSVTARGQKVFLESSCAVCHTVSGTLAGGRIGPTLSHVGSRLTIASGSLRNTRGNLGGWIVDPQGIKPGAKMPPNNIDPADLQALITYLESLK